MSLSPDDILKKEFGSRFRGYDREEVRNFLEEVAQAMTEVVKERNELRDKVVALKRRITQIRLEEEEIKRAIASAQRMSDELKEQARKEAGLIVEQARLDAERIVADAHKEAVQLEERIRKLRMMQREAVERIRGSFESYLRILDEEMALPPADVDETLRLAAVEVRSIQAETSKDDMHQNGERADGFDPGSVREARSGDGADDLPFGLGAEFDDGTIPSRDGEESPKGHDGQGGTRSRAKDTVSRDRIFDFDPSKLWSED